MRYIGKSSLSSFIKFFIVGLMGVALVCLVGLPWIFNFFVDWGYFENDTSNFFLYFKIILYITGVLSFLILNEMRKIFYSLENENPFIYENVVSLKRMSTCALAIAFIFITKVLVYNTMMTMLMVLVFFLAGLLALVLSEVFKSAVKYKEENDLTV